MLMQQRQQLQAILTELACSYIYYLVDFKTYGSQQPAVLALELT